MKTTIWKYLAAMSAVMFAPLASAHSAGAAHGESWLHYLSSPEHVPLIWLAVVFGVALTVVARRRKNGPEKD